MILQIGRPISGWRLATRQDNHRVTRSTEDRVSHRNSSFLIVLFDRDKQIRAFSIFIFVLPLPLSLPAPLLSLLFSFPLSSLNISKVLIKVTYNSVDGNSWHLLHVLFLFNTSLQIQLLRIIKIYSSSRGRSFSVKKQNTKFTVLKCTYFSQGRCASEDSIKLFNRL